MFWADQIGLKALRDRMLQFQKATGDAFWTPAPLLNRLADQGKGFLDK
jgi:3-hydroxyacyl-CoA dehydrogenase